MRNETIPADSLFSNRMQGMTLAVIGQLRATANWHRVMSEWLYGSAPSSRLGVAEAGFFGRLAPPVMDDQRFRAFDTLEDYRRWCEANLPRFLGYYRV